mmetsp:Transcript_15106/g.30464  ORF Transcript_15106/g.30464 Transcript_15106/m.30464 type:complete len:213 (+) Transcript_15106:165-803(+)
MSRPPMAAPATAAASAAAAANVRPSIIKKCPRRLFWIRMPGGLSAVAVLPMLVLLSLVASVQFRLLRLHVALLVDVNVKSFSNVNNNAPSSPAVSAREDNAAMAAEGEHLVRGAAGLPVGAGDFPARHAGTGTGGTVKGSLREAKRGKKKKADTTGSKEVLSGAHRLGEVVDGGTSHLVHEHNVHVHSPTPPAVDSFDCANLLETERVPCGL